MYFPSGLQLRSLTTFAWPLSIARVVRRLLLVSGEGADDEGMALVMMTRPCTGSEGETLAVRLTIAFSKNYSCGSITSTCWLEWTTVHDIEQARDCKLSTISGDTLKCQDGRKG